MKPFDGKRLAALALGALLCLCQAGCSFTGLDAQNLMSPPRANLEQQGIYELLQEGDSQELTFVYPKRGENRSAIIMKDWTGDGVSDAVGFVSTEGGGVRVSFLEKYQERWRTAASFVNAATQVDLVTFGDVNGDGAQDVLIGWGSAAGTTGRTAATWPFPPSSRIRSGSRVRLPLPGRGRHRDAAGHLRRNGRHGF